MRAIGLLVAAALLLTEAARGHAPLTTVPSGPMRVEGNRLLDSSNRIVLLRGVAMPGLEAFAPGPPDLETIAAMNALTFRVLRQRWNVNAVRLSVSPAIWRRDGPGYLARVGEIVAQANDAGLVAVLAAVENARSGAVVDTGLPAPELAAFWRAWADLFRNRPLVIFDVFHQPSIRNVPGASSERRRPQDWQFWLRGGEAANGRAAAGIADLVEAIRSTGAAQVIAVAAFHDRLGFQGLTAEFYVHDPNILYEIHPYFDIALTDAERDAAFGSLAVRFPLYAGEWGVTLLEDQPSCRSLPRDLQRAGEILFATLAYFDIRAIAWTAFAFQPRRLIADFSTYQATTLERLWNCGELANPQPGMGEFVLLWLTGDPLGFGALAADQTASAAGGPSGAIAPGEILSIYGFQMGPEPPVTGRLDAEGRLAASLGETEVLFDGVAAPLFYAGAFEIVVQVPYSVAGSSTTTVQAFLRGVPSNAIRLNVAESRPELFAGFPLREAVAVNQDGSRNASGAPAATGSIVVLYATGAGQTAPPSVTGRPAQAPFAQPALPVSLSIEGRPAEILYAGDAPGYVGLLQINARVPAPSPPPPVAATRAVPVSLSIGGRSNRSPVTLWVR